MLKWKLVLVYLEIVLILTQDSCKFAPNVPWARKSFWTHPMEFLGDMGHMESHFPFGDNVSVKCNIGIGYRVKRTIGSEIFLNAPDGTSR